MRDGELLVGYDSSDDACVYRVSDDTAVIETVDFFTPIVDDPYLFGQIAAANALSDVYAMGGVPKVAMNLLCVPNCLPLTVVRKILEGGHDKAVEAGSKYIEADIVVSGDGTVYLAHDDYAQDMTGTNGYFSGMTDGQIDKLKTKSGSNVIKLKDLFERYGDSVTYIVDIKYTGSRNVDAFTIAVRTSGVEDNVIAASSFFDVLRPLDETFPDMTKLYVCPDQATFELALDKDYVDIISVPKNIMTADNLKAAHEHGKKFSAWTLNTEDEISSAIELGVDSYFTDDTALAVGLEKERRTE